MDTKPPLSQAYRIWLMIGQVHHAMSLSRDKELKSLGVSTMKAGVLWTLARLDRPASPAELARMLFRTNHGVSQLLTRMQKQGLVDRPPSLQRNGAVRVVLTEKGRTTLKQIYDVGTVVDEIMSCLTLEERDTLKSLMEKLHESAFSQLVERPRLP